MGDAKGILLVEREMVIDWFNTFQVSVMPPPLFSISKNHNHSVNEIKDQTQSVDRVGFFLQRI